MHEIERDCTDGGTELFANHPVRSLVSRNAF